MSDYAMCFRRWQQQKQLFFAIYLVSKDWQHRCRGFTPLNAMFLSRNQPLQSFTRCGYCRMAETSSHQRSHAIQNRTSSSVPSSMFPGLQNYLEKPCCMVNWHTISLQHLNGYPAIRQNHS